MVEQAPLDLWSVNPEVLPPLQAFRYFPKGDELRNKSQRFVFYGLTKLDADEEAIVDEVIAFVLSNDKYSVIPQTYFSRKEICKVMYSSHFKVKQTADLMLSHFKWRKETLPPNPTPMAIKLINHGFITCYGRDRKYRPIVLINASVGEKIKDSNGKEEKLDVDAMVQACVLTMEYIVMNMLVPGTVENWDIILDFNKMSTGKIPRNEMGRVLGMCGEHYRCRMAKTWMLNTNTMINALYKMAGVFIDKDTKEKIKLTSKNFTDDMFEHIHPSQVWKKYGGTAEEPTQFWPPQCPSEEYGGDLSRLVSEEEHDILMEEYNSETEMRLLKPPEKRGPGDVDFIPTTCFDDYLMQLARPREHPPQPTVEEVEEKEAVEEEVQNHMDNLLQGIQDTEEKEIRQQSIKHESQRRRTTLQHESNRMSTIMKEEETKWKEIIDEREKEKEIERLRKEEEEKKKQDAKKEKELKEAQEREEKEEAEKKRLIEEKDRQEQQEKPQQPLESAQPQVQAVNEIRNQTSEPAPQPKQQPMQMSEPASGGCCTGCTIF